MLAVMAVTVCSTPLLPRAVVVAVTTAPDQLATVALVVPVAAVQHKTLLRQRVALLHLPGKETVAATGLAVQVLVTHPLVVAALADKA